MNLDRAPTRTKPAAERKLTHTPPDAPTGNRAASTKTVVVETIEYEDEGPGDEQPREPQVMAIDRQGRPTKLSAADIRLLAEVYVGGGGQVRGSATAGFMDMAIRMGLRFACGCRAREGSPPTMAVSGNVIVRDASTPPHAPGCRFERSAEDRRVTDERDATTVHHLAPIRAGVEPPRAATATNARSIRTRLGAALAHALRLAELDRIGAAPARTSWQSRILDAIGTMAFDSGRRTGIPAAASIHDIGRLRTGIMRDATRTPDSQPHGLLLACVDDIEDGAVRIGHERLSIDGTISIEGTGIDEGPYVAAILLASIDGGEPHPVEAYLMPCLDRDEPMPMRDASARRTVALVREAMAATGVADWTLRSETTGCGPTRLHLVARGGGGPTALGIAILASDSVAATEEANADQTTRIGPRAHVACHSTRPGANARRADELVRNGIVAAFGAGDGREADPEAPPTSEAGPERDGAAETTMLPTPSQEARTATHEEYLSLLRAIGMQVDGRNAETIYATLAPRPPSTNLLHAIGRRT